MVDSSIPKVDPYLPKNFSPEDTLPEKGELFEVKTTTLEREYDSIFGKWGSWKDITISKIQFFKKVHSHSLDCGDTCKHSVSVTFGSSVTEMEEIASSFNVGIKNLGATIESKLSTSVTLSEERKTTHETNFVADQCKGKNANVYQRIDRYVIKIISGSPWSKPKVEKHTLDYHSEDFANTNVSYIKKDCCQDEFQQSKETNYDKLIIITFPRSNLIRFAKTIDDGFSVEKIEGKYHEGSAIPTSKLSKEDIMHVKETGELPPYGFLMNYTGSTMKILGSKIQFALDDYYQTQMESILAHATEDAIANLAHDIFDESLVNKLLIEIKTPSKHLDLNYLSSKTGIKLDHLLKLVDVIMSKKEKLGESSD